MTVTEEFRAARDKLIELRSDYEAAREQFEWPRFTHFNFALDWFDKIAVNNDKPALWIVEQDGSEGKWSFAELSARSNQVANHLRRAGVKRGDHVMVMLNNQVELWETMLAGIKLGAVLMPATTQLGPIDLTDRAERGQAEFVVAGAEDAAKFDDVDVEVVRIVVGGEPTRQQDYSYSDADDESTEFDPQGTSRADDLMLLYFTSGTTSKAKMVAHTHVSYPVGHLSTMYWMGLTPGDVHLNVASPGWAKHAWSNIFTPWIAEACVFLYNYSRFDANALMETMDRVGVTSFCAPPTVWRMLIQADLSHLKNPPTKALGAGEPLNPEIIDRVHSEWGVLIRDGFGQTESTLQIGNSPDQELKYGSMGKALPGFDVVLIDPATGEEGDEGEICLRLDPRPIGLTTGYWSNPEKTAEAFEGGVYHTGDVASRDEDGYITYVGRADDVFKASDYRLSPSNSKACSSNTRPSPRRPSCPRRIRCDWLCPRRMSSSRASSLPMPIQHGRSSPTAVSTWHRTSASDASSSPSCRRRSPARSVASSCGPAKTSCIRSAANLSSRATSTPIRTSTSRAERLRDSRSSSTALFSPYTCGEALGRLNEASRLAAPAEKYAHA